MRELADRVGVVTGAASGIGRGIARAMAGTGMRLVVADVNAEALAAEATALREGGTQVLDVPTDVSNADAVAALAQRTLDTYGAVHVLVNNAGVACIGYQWETELADWQRVMDVNLFGVVHGVRSFVPHLLESPDGGHVVNVASMGGMIAGPLIGPYTASKHAVVGLSRSLRSELRMRGSQVGVTVVCPGHVRTGIAAATTPSGPVSSEAERMLRSMNQGSAEGLDPDEAGRRILDAVREDRFWVLPNGEAQLGMVTADHRELLDDAGVSDSV